MKTILVPTDFSKEARQAFIYALEMARITNSDIVLFHAFHQSISVGDAFHVEEVIKGLEKEKNELLKEWAAEVKQELERDFSWQFTSTYGLELGELNNLNKTQSGFHSIQTPAKPSQNFKITCGCRFGLAADGINEMANICQADLILISSKGAGPITQALLGSTVANVISTSQVPVLTLPQQIDINKLQTVVFAIDLNKLTGNVHLDLLGLLVKTFNANLEVLHIYPEKDLPAEQEKVLKGLDALDIHLHNINYNVHFRQRNDIPDGINEFIQQQKADLLVLAPRQHTFFEILLNKSVTEKLGYQNFIPILTLPHSTRPALSGRKILKEKKILNKHSAGYAMHGRSSPGL